MPLLVSYCCDIPEANDMSEVRHGVAVRRPFVRYVVPEEDIISGEKAFKRTVMESKMTRSSVLETSRKAAKSVEDRNELAD